MDIIMNYRDDERESLQLPHEDTQSTYSDENNSSLDMNEQTTNQRTLHRRMLVHPDKNDFKGKYNDRDLKNIYSKSALYDVETLTSDSSTNSNSYRIRRSKVKAQEQYGIYVSTKEIFLNGKKYKLSIPYHVSKCYPGSRIRNAITGVYVNALVGTSDEDLFFKVRIATGENGKTPYGVDMYFDSPKEYEKYFFIKLPQNVKDKWEEKNSFAKCRIALEMQKRQSVNTNVTIIN